MPIYEIEGKRPQVGKGTWVAPSAEIIGDVEKGWQPDWKPIFNSLTPIIAVLSKDEGLLFNLISPNFIGQAIA